MLRIMLAAPKEAWHLTAEGPDENFEKVVESRGKRVEKDHEYRRR
jgi:hypothetical protein